MKTITLSFILAFATLNTLALANTSSPDYRNNLARPICGSCGDNSNDYNDTSDAYRAGDLLVLKQTMRINAKSEFVFPYDITYIDGPAPWITYKRTRTCQIDLLTPARPPVIVSAGTTLVISRFERYQDTSFRAYGETASHYKFVLLCLAWDTKIDSQRNTETFYRDVNVFLHPFKFWFEFKYGAKPPGTIIH